MATTLEQLQAWMKSDREDEHSEFKAPTNNFDSGELWGRLRAAPATCCSRPTTWLCHQHDG